MKNENYWDQAKAPLGRLKLVKKLLSGKVGDVYFTKQYQYHLVHIVPDFTLCKFLTYIFYYKVFT